MYRWLRLVAMVAIIVFSHIETNDSTFASEIIDKVRKELSCGNIVCERMTKKLIGDTKPNSHETYHRMFCNLNMVSGEFHDQPISANLAYRSRTPSSDIIA